MGKIAYFGLIVACSLLGSTIKGARAADLPVVAPPLAPTSSCFSSPISYFEASPVECPLSWNGIALYGAIDTGGGYQTHGVPFIAYYPNGVEELISKKQQRLALHAASERARPVSCRRQG